MRAMRQREDPCSSMFALVYAFGHLHTVAGIVSLLKLPFAAPNQLRGEDENIAATQLATGW